jgi:hypothetical protein
VGLGDPVVLVVFVVFPASREEDSAVEPSFLFFCGDPEAPEGGGDVRGQIGGVGDAGGFTGDSKLEPQQGFGEGNRGTECFSSHFLFGAGPGKLEDVVDVSV